MRRATARAEGKGRRRERSDAKTPRLKRSRGAKRDASTTTPRSMVEERTGPSTARPFPSDRRRARATNDEQATRNTPEVQYERSDTQTRACLLRGPEPSSPDAARRRRRRSVPSAASLDTTGEGALQIRSSHAHDPAQATLRTPRPEGAVCRLVGCHCCMQQVSCASPLSTGRQSARCRPFRHTARCASPPPPRRASARRCAV